MKAGLLPIVVLALCFSFTSALASNRFGTVEYRFDLSSRAKGEEVRLWIPYPVSDEHQVISDVRISGDYTEAAVYADRVNRTPMLYVRWPEESSHREISYSFSVDRLEVVNGDLGAKEPAWNPADYALWLAPTRLGPTDGAVKALADRITLGKKTVLEKAKAVYDWVCENTYRNPDTRGCGAGDVCRLLETPGGKCVDISSVFIALARAAGVPCREVFGLRLGQKEGDDLTGAQHCWAEFFLPGRGWVQVDPADVRKLMLKENLENGAPRAAELRARFWAGVDPYRVQVSSGRDLELSPRQASGQVNYLMYPYAEAAGKPLDWLDQKSFAYTITFREK